MIPGGPVCATWASSIRRVLFACITVAVALEASAATAARLDPARTVGPDKCGNCHRNELETWRTTAHARIFDSDEPLHRRPRAAEIAGKLGIRLVKHDSLCLNCHYTPTLRSGKTTALAGVSCESCHGAARDWITVHNTFEGRQVNRAGESASQRERRWERNASIGMNFPGRLYDLLSQCYTCHTVPDERLVNTGGHSSGGGFDVVERVDQIRHNFVTTAQQSNAPITSERKRQLFAAGLMLELEHGLRGMSAATEDGAYARSQSRRIEKARRKLAKVQRRAALPGLQAVLNAIDGLKLTPGNADELAYSADKIAVAGRDFLVDHDGSKLAALDSFFSDEVPEDAAAIADGDADPEGEPVDDDAAIDASQPQPTADPATPAVAPGPTSASRRPEPEGKIRASIRTRDTAHATVGQGKCDSCHAEQNDWWFADRHFSSADGFLNQARKQKQIATLYYGKPAARLMATGKAVCMDCHGTVVTGREKREVDSGVSCEVCHGPAGDYLKPHPKQSRAERLAGGMRDLKALDRRAATCTGCHYITDARLLSSGHPSGKDFDYVDANRRIEHWKGGQPGGLAAAYRKALAARGAVPAVRVVSLGSPKAPNEARPGAGVASADRPSVDGATESPRSRTPRLASAPRPRPAESGVRTAASRPLEFEIPETPENPELQSVPEILRLVQQRLRALYDAVEKAR